MFSLNLLFNGSTLNPNGIPVPPQNWFPVQKDTTDDTLILKSIIGGMTSCKLN